MYKTFYKLILILLSLHSVNALSQNDYDSTLAKQYGADDYGMKMYVMVILKTGDAKIEEKAVRDSLFRGHMDNIHQMVADSLLIVAGPFGKNDQNYRGIFILDVAAIEEAQELMKNDPAIVNGVLAAEYLMWYGSAALPAYLEVSEKITKKKP